jgi:hypothetical protein
MEGNQQLVDNPISDSEKLSKYLKGEEPTAWRGESADFIEENQSYGET